MHVVAPTLRASPPPPRSKSHPIIWLSVTSIHCVCLLYAGAVALLYIRLPIIGQALVTTMELYTVSVPIKYFKTIAVAYFLLAGAHVLVLARITHASVRFRGFLLAAPEKERTLTDQDSMLRRLGHSVRRLTQGSSTSRRASISANAKMRRISNVALSTVKAYTSASKITDPNFGKLHAIREIIETAFLTTQAYKSSYRVASPWINSVQIFLLVLNCWSFTLAERLLRTSIGWTRMVCLYIHLCIDITIHIIIPTFLFLPYARVFNPSIGEFGIIFWYTDRWLVRVFNEFPMIFVTSFLDGVTKIFIGASIVRTLLDIPVLLAFIDTDTKQSKDDTKAAKEAAYAVDQKQPEQRATPAQPSKIERGCRVILLLWGACILALHFHASSHGHNPRCLQQVRPWLSRRAACSLAEINCVRSQSQGRAADIDAELGEIDRQWLTNLIIRHCPAVEMTPIVQELTNMVGFKVYNSTISRWNADAAITSHHHTRIMFVFLAATNMTEFPRGLYDADFPSHLADIEICRSNLTTLPDAVADVWPPALFLLLEEMQFPVIPPVLGKLQPYFLSLSVNAFTSIPTFVLQNPMLLFLKLGGNPLSSLPELSANDTIVPPLGWLYIPQTNVSDVPSWLDIDAMVALDAHDTPLCTRLSALDPSSPMDEKTAALKRRTRCRPLGGEFDMHHFPIALEQTINP